MIYKISKRIKDNHKIFLSVLFFSIAIFSFLYITGTLTSGYHFIDDHGMISIKNNLKETSFFEAVFNYTKKDLLIRFRPFYYFYYISVVEIFSLNFLAMSVFTGILAVSSFLFFYFGARKLKYGILESLIFVLLTFIGSQLAVWWRLGTNETIGMFFLGLAFLFMAKCTKKENYNLNNVIFIIFLIIASLCKESFVITIPAFIVFKIWNEKNVSGITFKESIKNNYLLIIPLVVMFIELAIIKFVVGTNKIGYAGVTSTAAEFWLGIKNILFNKISLLSWLSLIGGLLGLYLISFIFQKENKKTDISQSINLLAAYFCFSVLLVLPNIFMHAKSGMMERYLLPTTLGLAFLAISILKSTKHLFFKGVKFVIIIAFIYNSFEIAKTNAVVFASEGERANYLFKSVRKESKRSDSILLVVDPVSRYEVSHSIKTYLSYCGFNNFYAYPILRDYKTDFEIGLKEQWMKWFEGKSLKDIKGNPDLIIVFDKESGDRFFSESGLKKDDYNNIVGENYPHEVYSIK